MQELLNNIIKHAQASEAMVQLTLQDHMLSITIEDNGVGFDPAKLSQKGTGMSSIKLVNSRGNFFFRYEESLNWLKLPSPPARGWG